MVKRKLEKQLLQLIRHFPAVCILGPRQVGKTTLAKRLTQTVKKPVLYLDLERNYMNGQGVRICSLADFLKKYLPAL